MPRRANGEGSVFRLSDGSWRAACPGGRPSFRGSTRVEAMRRRDTYLRTHRKILSLPKASRDAFSEFLRTWLDSVGESLRPRTVESYYYTIERYILPVIGRIPIGNLTSDDIAAAMRDAKSPRTKNYVRTVCHLALAAAVKRELLRQNVAEDTPIVAVSVPDREMPSGDAWEVLRAAIAREVIGTRALLYVIVYGGLRVGEALGLKWFDYANGFLTITRAMDRNGDLVAVKTKKGRRRVSVGPDAIDALDLWRKEQAAFRERRPKEWAKAKHADLIFTTRYGSSWSQRNVLRAVHRVTSKTIGRRSTHYLRHLAISQLAADPRMDVKSIQSFAGHEDSRTTFNTYGHLIPGRDDVLVAAQERRAGRSTSRRGRNSSFRRLRELLKRGTSGPRSDTDETR